MRTFLIVSMILSLGMFVQVHAQDQKEMEKNIRQVYKSLLKETDKDKDGKLSKTEFYSIWKDQKVAEQNYKAWDTDKDGFITEDEYVKAAMDMGKKKK